MKGLILNNLYSVREGLNLSLLLAIVATTLLMSTENSTALKLSFYLPMALIAVNAFEVLKQDNLSGWDKFEFTLPLRRQKVVQSKYLTFLLLLLVSVAVTIGIFVVSSSFVTFSEGLMFISILRGIGFVLCLATIIYPLTYILGGDKSELIRIIGMIFSFVVFGIVYFLQRMAVGEVEGFDKFFSINFVLVSFFLFIVSYFISIRTYKRKEF